MNDNFIPFARPLIGEEEIAEVVQTLRSGWITSGPKVARFEKSFAADSHVSHAIAVNSATAGLHLGLEAAGVKKGDKVITTPYTFTATAEVIRYLGAHPVFVDVDRNRLTIDPGKVAEALDKEAGVKAVMPIHFGGLACEMDSILETAHHHDALVVGDSAHAISTRYRDRPIGSVDDISVFSFYATKNITTGEGGMITTGNEEMAARMRLMRLHGIDYHAWEREESSERASWYYEVVAPGFKYNMSDIAAAIGLCQLARAEDFRKRRQEIAEAYNAAFSDITPFFRPPYHEVAEATTEPFITNHAWHLYVAEVYNLSIDRGRFIEELKNRGIGASVHFIPLHLHPYWRNRYNFKPTDFPHALDLYNHCLSLPIYPAMTADDTSRVIEAVRDIVRVFR